MADKQGWGVSLSLTAVGILGALLGSAVQHLLTLGRERSKAFEERQSEAYVAFLSAFDKHRMSKQEEKDGRKAEADELMRQYELEAGAAVRRIAIFGDRRVVEAMANWYRRDALHPCDEDLKIELGTWETMRHASLAGGQEVSASDLAAIAGRCSLAGKQ